MLKGDELGVKVPLFERIPKCGIGLNCRKFLIFPSSKAICVVRSSLFLGEFLQVTLPFLCAFRCRHSLMVWFRQAPQAISLPFWLLRTRRLCLFACQLFFSLPLLAALGGTKYIDCQFRGSHVGENVLLL